MQSPLEIFSMFYEERNHAPMSGAQKNCIKELIHEIWEDEQ